MLKEIGKRFVKPLVLAGALLLGSGCVSNTRISNLENSLQTRDIPVGTSSSDISLWSTYIPLTELDRYKPVSEFYSPDSLKAMPCGPIALWETFNYLGNPLDLDKINSKRIGGFSRNVLSLFNKAADMVTWPKEIKAIANDFNYNVSVLSGKDATLENARDFTTNNSAVIMQLKSSLLKQHYQFYDPAKVNDLVEVYKLFSKYGSEDLLDRHHKVKVDLVDEVDSSFPREHIPSGEELQRIYSQYSAKNPEFAPIVYLSKEKLQALSNSISDPTNFIEQGIHNYQEIVRLFVISPKIRK